MMPESLQMLAATAAGIGLLHTVIGVDHTLPFIAIGRAQGWSLARTLRLTTLCGLAHVASSMAVAAVGIAIGSAVGSMVWLETVRGEFAAWALIIFGCTYAAWAWARRHRPHVHNVGDAQRVLGTWGLFIIFVLGPCEPLIPLLIVPGLQSGWMAAFAVTAIFTVCTLAAMLTVVTLGYLGLRSVRVGRLTHHADVLAGCAVAASGAAIKVLGI
jgi:nickel/cobalt transporter (NicO) family protein